MSYVSSAWWGCFILPPLPETEEPRGTNEPKNMRLSQQAMAACKPVLDTVWVVFIFAAIGIVLIPIGAVCAAYGIKPVEVSARYETCFNAFPGTTSNWGREKFIWANANNDAALTCTLLINITQNMSPPIYVFYEMNGFFQNNRRYVSSRSDQQLVNYNNPDTSYCLQELNYEGNSSQIINPCGLTAWTNFNDSYTVSVLRQAASPSSFQQIPITSKGIAPEPDQSNMFAAYNTTYFNPSINQYRGGANITVPVNSDDRFIIWMKLAPLSKFRKLWGLIETPLFAGDVIEVSAVNRYNSFAFNGQKSIVLSTTTWLGGVNPFLGISFLVTGCVSVVVGVLYFITAVYIRPRQLGDLSVLQGWDDK
ncbi:hypothetical protein CEUSTIGMA_g12870.t1 [Chlamydomonas eustigma]|uniref:ALA-interacting subunit n=1 Tax=Chlamydomonas eustigma TaxID=1157962 RepID=A0A250XQW7_9CHLO|nr:hypothetical protein CEUSTIGMA_g12870.t1 [Chlamydomonas eustigma]|eukprot:GAX85454.1 hypothetical protein CEUSTIGMA_g12870.t1 [Chlamydomonas eustigma]